MTKREERGGGGEGRGRGEIYKQVHFSTKMIKEPLIIVKNG